MPNSFAIFDTLYIILQTRKQSGGLSINELNFLSYFSCLLSLYKGHPVSEWGYTFLRNSLGAPVCADLSESCTMLENRGDLRLENAIYTITPIGESHIEFYKELEMFKERIPYLNAACDCLLIESILDILNTISKDALIVESSAHTVKYLNSDDNSSLALLHEQFNVVKEAIGNRSNLFVPATSWLLYLKQSRK